MENIWNENDMQPFILVFECRELLELCHDSGDQNAYNLTHPILKSISNWIFEIMYTKDSKTATWINFSLIYWQEWQIG